MLRKYVRDDLWNWSPLTSFRHVDADFRQLVDILWSPVSSTYCDSNGVLTLSPTYRIKKTKNQTEIEIDIPGVRKDAVSVETKGNRLKVIAAKYTPDGRTALCSKARKPDKKDTQDEHASHLPTLVYKLYLKLSSRSDVEAVYAKHTGDGLLIVKIPNKEDEPVRKINVHVDG